MAGLGDSEWQVESVRVSSFYTQPDQQLSHDIWLTVIGNDPDQILLRPKDAVTQVQGTFEGGLLTTNLTPGRCDWIFQGIPSSSGPANPPSPTLGNFSSGIKELEGPAKKWLTVCPSLNRLAFGMALLIPADSVDLAYKKLQEFLPHIAGSGASATEFNYQVNRPQQSQVVSGMQVNRVERWNIAQGGAVSVNIKSGEASVAAVLPVVACRLELDVNTVVPSNPIPESQKEALLTELIEEGCKIVSRKEVA